MTEIPFSKTALSLDDSVTHGTRASVEASNQALGGTKKILDLSIGTLDMPTDLRIDEGVRQFIRDKTELIHAFAPVKGFHFLRESIAARTKRLHKIDFDPESEILITPGGIKGSLAVMFHTFLNPGEEVIVPVPNWPHYVNMLKLHGALPKAALPNFSINEGLTPSNLEYALSDRTKLIILGDCINPTGKIYSSEELYALAQVITKHNLLQRTLGKSPAYVIFDCPYEAHIFGPRAKTFADTDVHLEDGKTVSMREYTLTITGPGKTYGMHGDCIGYICAPKDIIDMAARVQVNLNSFASTYGQVATFIATQEYMDEVATHRSRSARAGLDYLFEKLSQIPDLNISYPQGGYFLFVDFSSYSFGIKQRVTKARNPFC